MDDENSMFERVIFLTYLNATKCKGLLLLLNFYFFLITRQTTKIVPPVLPGYINVIFDSPNSQRVCWGPMVHISVYLLG